MFDRGAFFDSILGTFVGTTVPFRVTEALPQNTTALIRLNRLVELFNCKPDTIYRKVKIAIVLKEDIRFWMSKIDIAIQDREKLILKLTPYALKVEHAIVMTGMELCTHDELFLKRTNFCSEITMSPGDILKTTYTFEVPGL